MNALYLCAKMQLYREKSGYGKDSECMCSTCSSCADIDDCFLDDKRGVKTRYASSVCVCGKITSLVMRSRLRRAWYLYLLRSEWNNFILGASAVVS